MKPIPSRTASGHPAPRLVGELLGGEGLLVRACRHGVEKRRRSTDGAASCAEAVGRTLTDRIERWVNQAPGVADVESRSVSGVSVVELYFQDGIDPSTAPAQTNSLTGAAMPYPPTNTLPPVSLPVRPDRHLPLGIFTVSNPLLSEQEVRDLARVEVRNRLGAARGRVTPVVVGGKDRRVMIYLDRHTGLGKSAF